MYRICGHTTNSCLTSKPDLLTLPPSLPPSLAPPSVPSDSAHEWTSLSYLHWYHILAISLFLWASYHQHTCHKILAGLRKGGRGKRGAREKYGRPDGDWFELVSSPHLFAEVLVYVAVLTCVVVWEVDSCWWLVVVYVVSTLTLSARQTHSWYQHKFEDYPAQRYAILPWIC